MPAFFAEIWKISGLIPCAIHHDLSPYPQIFPSDTPFHAFGTIGHMCWKRMGIYDKGSKMLQVRMPKFPQLLSANQLWYFYIKTRWDSYFNGVTFLKTSYFLSKILWSTVSKRDLGVNCELWFPLKIHSFANNFRSCRLFGYFEYQ